jgi:hypothetical protein
MFIIGKKIFFFYFILTTVNFIFASNEKKGKRTKDEGRLQRRFFYQYIIENPVFLEEFMKKYYGKQQYLYDRLDFLIKVYPGILNYKFSGEGKTITLQDIFDMKKNNNKIDFYKKLCATIGKKPVINVFDRMNHLFTKVSHNIKKSGLINKYNQNQLNNQSQECLDYDISDDNINEQRKNPNNIEENIQHETNKQFNNNFLQNGFQANYNKNLNGTII